MEERTEKDKKILKRLLLNIMDDWHTGDLSTIEFLVEKEHVDLNYDGESYNPMLTAARCRQLDIVKYLVEHGANVNCKNYQGNTPLHFAAERELREDIVKYLIEQGADLNVVNKDGYTPFHFIILKGNLNNIKFCVEHGANINLPDKNGNTPLHMLILKKEYYSFDIIKYLIQQGADLTTENNDENNPLELAIEKEKSEIAKYILKISKQNK